MAASFQSSQTVALLGGGPGGYEAALAAAQLGAEVTLIERAAIGGAALACLTLAAVQQFVVVGRAEAEIQTIRWIDWANVGWAMAWLAIVAVVLSIIPTLIATRRFLRV